MERFLKLNGWPISVAINTPKRVHEVIGGNEWINRAFDGTPLSTRLRTARNIEFTTTHLTALEARALTGILLGEGRYWPFDSDLWDVKGLPFESGTAELTLDGVYGAAAVVLDDLKADTGIEEPWTILVWRGVKYLGGSAFLSPWFPSTFGPGAQIEWAHYAIRSDGLKWKDGERFDDADTSWIRLEDGDLTLVAEQPSGYNAFDDLVVLPFLAPADLVRGVYGLGRPYPRLPYIDVEGLATEGKVKLYAGEIRNDYYAVWGLNGEHHRDGQRIEGVLHEA